MYALHGVMNDSLATEAAGDELSCQDCTSTACVGSSVPVMRAMPVSSSTPARRCAVRSCQLGWAVPDPATQVVGAGKTESIADKYCGQ